MCPSLILQEIGKLDCLNIMLFSHGSFVARQDAQSKVCFDRTQLKSRWERKTLLM